MTILFFSDVHADAVTMGVRRLDEVKLRLNAIKNYVTTQNIKTVVFGGDWCDPTPDGWACIMEALSFDLVMRRTGTEMLWLTGNHDVVEDGLGSSVLSPLRGAGATVIDKPQNYTTSQGANLGFLPFTPRALAYDPAEVAITWGSYVDSNKPRLIFGHLNLKDAVPGSETTDMPRGREVQWPLAELAQYLPNAKLFGGHYHKGENVKGVEVVGSPSRFTFGEEDNDPGFMLIEPDGSFKRMAMAGGSTFRTLHYDVDSGHLYYKGKKFARPEKAPAKKLLDLVAGAFVRVHASRDFADAAQMEQDLRDCGAHAVRIEVGKSDVQPAAATGQPLQTVSDGIAEAKRLASEWATADVELKEAIVGLVDAVALEDA